MKRLALFIIVVGLTVFESAHARSYVFFVPKMVYRSHTNLTNGAPGDICVKEDAKVGEVLTSRNGNTAKVLSLFGRSWICADPTLPIRAELSFIYNFSSKAGIELPDEFKLDKLTDFEMFEGNLLKATSKDIGSHGIRISATIKKANSDIEMFANNIERTFKNNPLLKDVVTARTEKLTIHGMPAVRFEISGTLSGIFGKRITYQYTIIEAEKEVVVVNVYAPLEYVESHRSELQKFAEEVNGLQTEVEVVSGSPTPASPP